MSKFPNDPFGVLTDFSEKLDGEVNLDVFYYNALTVQFVPTEQVPLKNNQFLAVYNATRNFIVYRRKRFLDAIMHELLHMASTVRTKDKIYSGLSVLDLKTMKLFGAGITEAYTCILDERYFEDYTKTKKELLKNSYLLLKDLMWHVVEFASQEVVDKAYFEVDQEAFIEALTPYVSRDKVIKFIDTMDKLLDVLNSTENAIKSLLCTPAMFNYYREAMAFIAELYLSGIYENYYLRNMDDDEYRESLVYVKEFVDTPLRSTYIKWLQSKPFSNDEFKALVKSSKKNIIKKYT